MNSAFRLSQSRFLLIQVFQGRQYTHSVLRTQINTYNDELAASILVQPILLWNSSGKRRLSVQGITEPTIYHHENRIELNVPRWPKPINLSHIWLRDHCRCRECFNHSTYQRTKDVQEISLNIKPAAVTCDDKTLSVIWPDGHSSEYDFKFLWQSTYEGQKYSLANVTPTTWTKTTFPSPELTTVSAGDFLGSKEGKAKLVETILKYGVGFVSEASPSGETTRHIIEALCPIKNTCFGNIWTITAGMDIPDTAYSKEFLGAHTDSTYFNEAPRIQVFHCLKPAEEGGETLLVDGFSIAEQLRKSAPKTYEFLSCTPVPFQYIGDEQHYVSVDVLFKHHPVKKSLVQFRYNPYDRAPLSSIPFEHVDEYYRHLQKLTSVVRRPANEMWCGLQPGSILFIDNWRVMHGRKQYKGTRILEGCYLDNNDFTSKARLLGFLVD